jgi:hypothetical protein
LLRAERERELRRESGKFFCLCRHREGVEEGEGEDEIGAAVCVKIARIFTYVINEND